MKNYYKEFLKSPLHAWTAVLTLGAGLAAANPLFMIIGGALYALAWIYIPDTKGFKARIDKLRAAKELSEKKESSAATDEAQLATLAALSKEERQRFADFQQLSREIRKTLSSQSSAEYYPMEMLGDNLNDIESTYLRLLSQRNRLSLFLTKEKKEPLDLSIQQGEQEIAALREQIAKLNAQDPLEPSIRTRERTLELQSQRVESLKQRKRTFEAAQANWDLVEADRARIEEHLKLLLADASSRLDSGSFSSHVDTSMQQLAQTKEWLNQLEEQLPG